MREQDFQDEVTSIADKNGWLWFHRPYGAGQTRRGWPDLVLVHPRRKLLLFRELKINHGVLKKEQSEFLDALRAIGADAKVWRPKDLNEILKVLRGRQKTHLGRVEPRPVLPAQDRHPVLRHRARIQGERADIQRTTHRLFRRLLKDEAAGTQEAQEIFKDAYKKARAVYTEKDIFKATGNGSHYGYEQEIKQEALNEAYKAAKAYEAFNKAFQDYEKEKEVREAEGAYKAFAGSNRGIQNQSLKRKAKEIETAVENAYKKAREIEGLEKNAYEKAKSYKSAREAEKAAKSIEIAAENAAKKAKEEAARTKKVARKADKRVGEGFDKMKKAAEKKERAKKAFETEVSEIAFNEALSAEGAFSQAKRAYKTKEAEAEKAKKEAEKKEKEAEKAEKDFELQKEKAKNATSRTYKVREATERAAADAGLNIKDLLLG